MPKIPVTKGLDLSFELQLEDKSDLAKCGLRGLKAKADEFLKSANSPLNEVPFRSTVLEPEFNALAMQLETGVKLALETDASLGVSVYHAADGSLFDAGDGSPGIPVGPQQCWVAVSLDGTLDFTVGASTPSGWGVSGEQTVARSITSYVLMEEVDGHFPTLSESVENALSQFDLAPSPAKIRAQVPNTVQEWDLSGTFQITGTYSLPLAVNKFSLANAKLPFGKQLTIPPEIQFKVSGTVAVTGEFRGRCYRGKDAKVQLGLYKKKETDLSAGFQAQAGLGVDAASTDVVAALFKVLPAASFDSTQIPDADRKVMSDALGATVKQGFCVALNSSCSASVSDEAAVLYEIDLGEASEQTDTALKAALRGDWTLLTSLKNARALRNILTETHEHGGQTSLNLLGVYDYASMDDFVRSCTIVHNPEDGTVTITDKATAQRFAVAEMPFAAHDDKLRKVLDQAFLATASYAATGSAAPLGVKISASQSLALYKDKSNTAEVKRNLRLGAALGLLTQAEVQQIPAQDSYRYFRMASRATFEGDDAMRLFFSDVATRTGYGEPELKQLGRKVLVSLLDPANAVDQVRIAALTNEAIWSAMEEGKFPEHSPASRVDWYDIARWADAITSVAPRLKKVLDALDRLTATDPTKDDAFMIARKALAKAIADVTNNTDAAFEKGWPLAVTFVLTGRTAPVVFEARWDGNKQFERETVKTLTA